MPERQRDVDDMGTAMAPRPPRGVCGGRGGHHGAVCWLVGAALSPGAQAVGEPAQT
jgi:hypothetical protein